VNKRRVTMPVHVGEVKVGGGADITVQSMTKSDTRDVAATVRQILELEEVGCEIIRCAVPDMEAAQAMAEIKKQINIPPHRRHSFPLPASLGVRQGRRRLPAAQSGQPSQ